MALIPNTQRRSVKSPTVTPPTKPLVTEAPIKPNNVNRITPVKKTVHASNGMSKRKKLLLLLGTCIVIVVIIGAYTAWHVNAIYHAGLEAKNDLVQVQTDLQAKRYELLGSDFSKAQLNLASTSSHLASIRWLSWLPWVGTQYQAVDGLVASGVHVTAAGVIVADLGEVVFPLLEDSSAASLDHITGDQRQALLSAMAESPEQLTQVQTELAAAVTALETVPTSGVIAPLAAITLPIQDKLPLFNDIVDKALPFLKVAPGVLGYPSEKTYLVLFQNNTELRPTGGFIGSYGTLVVKNADIKSFNTQDIYNLDVPVKNELFITPPEPMQRYMGSTQWFMRDANWDPDFPTTAEVVEDFYFKEHGEANHLDGVLTLTPEVIHQLLYITGPITIEGDEYNAENFTHKLQYEVEFGFRVDGVSNDSRKQVIGKLASELLAKVKRTPRAQWAQLAEIIFTELNEKHILLYFNDPAAQDLIADLNWGGEIKQTDSDFLMVVDANLAAYKTDRVMDKTIDYQLTPDGNSYKVHLTLHYKNNGTFDQFTTRYRSYTRIYVPEGSTLTASKGFMTNDRIQSGDPVAAEVMQDNTLHKTIFQGFLSAEPKTDEVITLDYILPQRIADQIKAGQYNMYLQKQPGTSNVVTSGDWEFGNDIGAFTELDGLSKTSHNKLHLNSPLLLDHKWQADLR